MRVAFFTAGTRGAWHNVRGLAIRRALERRGFRGELRLFGPDVADWSIGFDVVKVAESELRDASRAKESALAHALAAFAPDLLLVDMFWAPLLHVLPIAGCEAWLLLRAFADRWLAGPPGHPFDVTQYARRIAIEPIVVAGEITDRIEPIVVANHDEQRPHGALRQRVGAAVSDRLVAVVHAGNPGEIHSLVPALGAGERLVMLDLHAGDDFFPAAEWLRDADVVHAGAGYNTFWEAQWLGWAAHTHFTAFARSIDRQPERVAAAAHRMKENGADQLAAMILAR